MRRLLLLTVMVTAVAWADAQQPLTAADKLKHLQADRALLEKLVGQGVQIAAANDSLARADACRKVMADLGGAMETALAAKDSHRVAELGEHYIAIADNGLIPNLVEALPFATVGSPSFPTFTNLKESSTGELQKLHFDVSNVDSVSRTPAVKTLLTEWGKTQAKLAAVK